MRRGRKPQRYVPAIDMARVIRDPRDDSKDYHIPRTEARVLYNEGKLAIDETNSKPNEVVYTTLTVHNKEV